MSMLDYIMYQKPLSQFLGPVKTGWRCSAPRARRHHNSGHDTGFVFNFLTGRQILSTSYVSKRLSRGGALFINFDSCRVVVGEDQTAPLTPWVLHHDITMVAAAAALVEPHASV